ncbi:hypothetical protein MXB_3550, partial [Myxobolus squamalis]
MLYFLIILVNFIQNLNLEKENILNKDIVEFNNFSNETCVPSSITQFPPDIFENSNYPKTISIFHLAVALYIFWAIAILCEHYFIPCLENLSFLFNIRDDIAGATLMAIGGSMPELFVSIIGVFITKGDIGTGTILGSSVLNLVLVIGLCGLVATTECLSISWYPVTRDILLWPIKFVYSATIPSLASSGKEILAENRRQTILLCIISFIISIFWIGVLTYILIWMIVIISHNYEIPESIVGTTFVAFGSSVPDIYCSLIVVRKGLGDMAICHSIGSNTFDLLIGLGLPYLLATFYRSGLNIFYNYTAIKINSYLLIYSCIMCIISIIVVWLILYVKNWKLTRKISVFLLLFYSYFL